MYMHPQRASIPLQGLDRHALTVGAIYIRFRRSHSQIGALFGAISPVEDLHGWQKVLWKSRPVHTSQWRQWTCIVAISWGNKMNFSLCTNMRGFTQTEAISSDVPCICGSAFAGISKFSTFVARETNLTFFRALINCLQVASGCLSSHRENIPEQHFITLPWLSTAIAFNSDSTCSPNNSPSNSVPTSRQTSGLLVDPQIWILTCLFRYAVFGLSSAVYDQNYYNKHTIVTLIINLFEVLIHLSS